MIVTNEFIVEGELVVLGTLTLLSFLPVWSYRAITANYTLGAGGVFDELVNITANSVTVTFPTAVGFDKQFTVKNSGSGLVTLATTSAQTIDGDASGVLTLVQYDSITVRSDGTNWIII